MAATLLVACNSKQVDSQLLCAKGCPLTGSYCPVVRIGVNVDSLAATKITRLYTPNPYDTLRVNWGNGLTDILVSEPDTTIGRNVVKGRLYYTYQDLGKHTIMICGPVELVDVSGLDLTYLKATWPNLSEVVYSTPLPADSLNISGCDSLKITILP